MSESHLSTGGSILSGALFVAGTSVGAGMLALPFVTGIAGFWPAMSINCLCWLFMLCTGLLFLEVTLWMPDGANLLSMAYRFLGRWGWIVAGCGFLYLYYCLLVAYFSGGSALWGEAFLQIFGLHMSPHLALVSFAGIFALIVFLGTWVSDKLNFALMAGLIISYLLLVGVGSSEVMLENLAGKGRWGLAFLAIPTVFSAYGYHNVIPSISTYLKRDAHKLRLAIVIGTSIPFIVFAVWQWLIIGTVPTALLEITRDAGESIAQPLSQVVQNRWVPTLTRYFALFAIQTSILGVGISMVDFLGDGTGIRRKGLGRLLLAIMVFFPPFLFAYFDPTLFFKALHYAGVFGEAVLNGFFPVMMVWVGRYRCHLTSDYQLPGGRWLLSLLLAITFGIIGFEIMQLIERSFS
ncbi:MAG: tyrosine transporter [Verrucomicrobia bacterium]|nr:tyrosine transporter [Verrucomicrobiota bacterium]